MKIFILFISFFLSAILFVQAQPTIDFETGGNGATYTWTTFENVGNPVVEIINNPDATGINTSAKVAKFTALQAGQPWAGLESKHGDIGTFTLSAANSTIKIMVWKTVISDVGIKFAINSGGAQPEIKVANTKVNEWEELTFDFSGKIGLTESINIDQIIIFPDFAARAQDNIVFFDNITFSAQGTSSATAPTVSAPVPTKAAADVISIFSDAYANVAATNFNPNWGQATVATQVSIAGNNTLKYENLNYQGTEFGSDQDVSGKTTLHVDYWTSNSTALKLFLISRSSGEKSYTFTVTKGSWVGVDIPLTDFSNQGLSLTDIFQFKFEGNGTVYLDNLYFSTNAGGGTKTLPVLPLDFQSATTDYTFTDFEGGVVTVIDNPQSNTINTSTKVGKMVKNAGAVYAGSLIALASPMDFTTNKIFKVKVFMPKVGAKLLLKVENQTDPSKNYEKEMAGTVANAWEELTFDYSAINTANQYQKIILIFDNGTVGDGSANFTYLFDDLRLTTSGGNVSTSPVLPLDFESTTITYAFTDFNGGGTTVIDNPQMTGINTSAKVGKMIKSAGQPWGGSWTSLASPIDFSTNKSFKVKVFMPRVGAKLLLKVENQTNGAVAFEKEATGTVANAWEELTFDYSTINTANQYQKLVLIFDLGTNGDGTANFTYLFDDIRLVASNGGVVTLTQMNLPVTFDIATVEYGLAGFGGADASTVVTDPTLSTNKVAKVVKSAGAETWAGTTITAVSGNVQTGFSSKIPFTTSEKKMNVRVWSPDAGVKVLMKVEDYLDPTKSVETAATTTVAGNWETLNFDFGIQSEGTAALNLAYNYNKASIFFNFGVTGAVAGEKTYYFDDVKFGAAVILQSQTITFPDITDKTAGGASFALTATASSGLAVTYSTTSDKITISGSQVTIVKAGRASITASQSGNASFNPAASVINSFCIKPAKPVITINGGNTEAVTLTSSATTGNQWYLNGTAISNATNATVAATSQGLYKVKVTVDDCVSEFSDETALIVTGDIQTLFKQVSAYPNPAENYLEVRGIEGELTNAQLFDLTGRANMIVFEKNGDVHQANVQHITKGVYLLKLTAGNKIHQIKIIKN